MRQQDIRTDGTLYAYSGADSYARSIRGRPVEVLETGLHRIVSQGFRSVKSDRADGVLVRFPDGRPRWMSTEAYDVRKPKQRKAHTRGLAERYEQLPDDQAIVRSAEIVERWDEHVKRHDAREAREERAKEEREARKVLAMRIARELADYLELDRQSHVIVTGLDRFRLSLSARAAEKLADRLSLVD